MHPVRGLRLVARGQERLEEDDEVRLRRSVQPGSRGTRVQQKHLRGIVPESSDGALPGTVFRPSVPPPLAPPLVPPLTPPPLFVELPALAPDALPPQNLLRVRQRVAKLRRPPPSRNHPARRALHEGQHQRRHLGRLAHRRAVQVPKRPPSMDSAG